MFSVPLILTLYLAAAVDIKDTVIPATDSAGSAAAIVSPLTGPDLGIGRPAMVDSVVGDSVPPADTAWPAAPRPRPDFLYPGISEQQDAYARSLMDLVWSFKWDEVEHYEKRMQRLERRERLPPLSYLLMVSQRIWRVQNDDLPDERAEAVLVRDILRLAQKGLELSDPRAGPDSLAPTNMLINSGIRGFVATLKMGENPIDAAIQGYQALRMLEQLVAEYPAINDAYLGLGIFYCALAKAPPVVRGAVNITGRSVSLAAGLDYLRVSAYQGRYTNTAGKLYLIQFLSPFSGDLAEEKERIFRSLQQDYSRNPYFIFLELDENICFHHARVTAFSRSERLQKAIRGLRTTGSCRKYANLVKWQYRIIDPFPRSGFEPDTTTDLQEFAYYPLFLLAVRERMVLHTTAAPRTDQLRRVVYIRRAGETAQRMLRESRMGPARKGYYAWHLRDALRTGR